jgi:hypothetical protein
MAPGKTGLVLLGVLLLTASISRSGEPERRNRLAARPPDLPRVWVYEPPSIQPLPPQYPYAYGADRLYRPPPVGFGSPYYNGFNDPYFDLYGPGVREFLWFGGADFYGW